jgi:hypothetical protein
MNTKKYFCEEWELSSVSTTETKRRVKELVERFKKFENLLSCLDLKVTGIELYAGDYGVHVHIDFKKECYPYFLREVEVISAYLKAHLPMRRYDNVMVPKYSKNIQNYHLEYELDIGGYEFEYPSQDYFYTSFNT